MANLHDDAPEPYGIRWRLSLLLPIACLLASTSTTLASATADGPKERTGPITLEPDSPVEGDISPGQHQDIQLMLQQGQFVFATIAQEGIDLTATLQLPDGTTAIAVELYGPDSLPETICWVAEVPGSYTISIAPTPRNEKAGHYVARIEETHTAQDDDRTRCRADNLYIQAKNLTRLEDAASIRRAIDLYEESLPLFLSRNDIPSAASTLNNMGVLASRLGDLRGSLAYLERSLELWRQTDDRSSLANTLQGIGNHHETAGNPTAALRSFEECRDIYRALGDTSGEAMCLSGIARIDRYLGRMDESLEILLRVEGMYRSVDDTYGEARTFADIGESYEQQGQLQRALDSQKRAAALLDSLGDIRGRAAMLSNIAGTYTRLGDPERALEGYEASLRITRSVGNKLTEAIILGNIGALYNTMRQYAKAIPYHKEAMELAKQIGAKRQEASALDSLGLAYANLRRLEEAGPLLHTALSIWRALQDRYREGKALEHLGIYHRFKNDLSESADYFHQALDVARELGDRSLEASLLGSLARTERRQGYLAAARGHLFGCLETYESIRAAVADPALRSSFFANWRDPYELLVDTLLQLAAQHPEQGFTAEALDVSERARARSLMEQLSESAVEVRRGIPEELRQREVAASARLSRVQSELLEEFRKEAPAEETIRALRAELRTAEGELGELRQTIRRQHPRYADLKDPSPLRTAEIQGLLDDGTALLEFLVSKERSVLFVVAKDELRSYPLPGAEEIADQVHELDEALRASLRRRGVAQLASTAYGVYQTLLAPAEEQLRGKKRLLISPDGPLYSLAFESLVTAPPSTADYRDLRFLIERWPVSYVPSATVLAGLDRRREGAAPQYAVDFLGVGDPVFGLASQSERAAVEERLRSFFPERGTWRLERLPATAHEVESIAGLFPEGRSTAFLEAAASEENVKHSPLLGHARRLHFATHGLVDEDTPTLSGLVLTLDDDPSEDGLLQAYEIYNLELTADLAVLSACDTGLGKKVRGEGIIGLTRAFFYAGVPSVVVSLWQVADDSTADLMVRFYRHLAAGEGKAASLRAAKLELLRDGSYANPYHWAPFILVGAP